MNRPTHYVPYSTRNAFACYFKELREHLNNNKPTPKRRGSIQQVTCPQCLKEILTITKAKLES